MHGFSLPIARPEGAPGTGAAFEGRVRGGYAFGHLGFEVLGDIGGNWVGPRAVWFDGGARWMFTPGVHRTEEGLEGISFHVGGELLAGGFVRIGAPSVVSGAGTTYESSSRVAPVFGAAVDLAVGLTPRILLEAQLGNLRWVPMSDGTMLLVGATLGASFRF